MSTLPWDCLNLMTHFSFLEKLKHRTKPMYKEKLNSYIDGNFISLSLLIYLEELKVVVDYVYNLKFEDCPDYNMMIEKLN